MAPLHEADRITGPASRIERSAVVLLVALVAMACGCATPPPPVDAQAAETDTPRRIYVVRHDWHTGVVVPAADIPAGAWPARREFATAEYFEVGWGDRAYYQADDAGIWLGLRALLWPAPGVLHIVAFSGPVDQAFRASEIVELRLSVRGLAQLVAKVADSHELNEAGQPIVFGPGRYGASRFYASRENFHLFRTCNVWTASLLREAGVPLPEAPTLTAAELMSQLRPLGRVIRSAP